MVEDNEIKTTDVTICSKEKGEIRYFDGKDGMYQ